MAETFTTTSEASTRNVARSFAARLQRGDVVALFGDLGTGKTQFVKGVCETFGVEELVTSPSFVILNRYEGKDGAGNEILIYHLDLYRVKSVEEIFDLGYEEFFYGDGICLVEWAERLGDLIPPSRHEVRLSLGEEESHRLVHIEHVSSSGIDAPSDHPRESIKRVTSS